MDNLAPGFPTKVFVTALRNWLGNKPMQWIATKDIGVFAAKAFTNPREWDRRAVGLAGDELNFDQMNRMFKSVTSSPAPVTYSVFGSALTFMVPELRAMISWFSTGGYHANIKLRRIDHPGMMSFIGWLEHDSLFQHIE
jgi:hypothetical protein